MKNKKLAQLLMLLASFVHRNNAFVSTLPTYSRQVLASSKPSSPWSNCTPTGCMPKFHKKHFSTRKQVGTELFFFTELKRSFIAATLACTILLSPSLELLPSNTITITTPIASASDYGSLTDEQKAVAEAWRIVDNNFFDRTFNKQDWWKIRQNAVKKKYNNMAEAQLEIEGVVSSLGKFA